jgi:large subunit ribosomal protein L27e
MTKFLKPNKVVVITKGRQAGKKAVIVKNFDEGEKAAGKKYGFALVVGIDRAPLKVTKSMSQRKIMRRSRVKPFLKLVNYNHVMPTRYTFEVDLKERVSVETTKDPAKKKEAKKAIRKVLEEKYKTGQNKWFFQKLRF